MHILFLLAHLDCTLAGRTNIGDRLPRVGTSFNKQAGGYRTGAAEAAFAVHEDAVSPTEDVLKIWSCGDPSVFERSSRSGHVADWQMEPSHCSIRHGRAHVLHFQRDQLMSLYKGHNGNSTPGSDSVEVYRQVSRPGASHCMWLPLAWAKADADATKAFP
jgi:hypothetical protein